MLKKLLTAIAFLIYAVPAMAGNVSIPSGPLDPANVGAQINTLIISGNANWAPQGNSFLTTAIMSSITASTALVVSGNAGVSPTGNVSWLKVKGYINSTTTPTFYMIPLWGCPTCN